MNFFSFVYSWPVLLPADMHHQGMSIVRIILTLSGYPTLLPSVSHLDSTQYPNRADECKFLLVCSYVGVHMVRHNRTKLFYRFNFFFFWLIKSLRFYLPAHWPSG